MPVPCALPALREGTLVRVLPQYQLQGLNIYALYASRQYLDAKIRTWIDLLREELPAVLAADEAEIDAMCAPVDHLSAGCAVEL